jgi:Xaa-Pro aminopeptidase
MLLQRSLSGDTFMLDSRAALSVLLVCSGFVLGGCAPGAAQQRPTGPEPRVTEYPAPTAAPNPVSADEYATRRAALAAEMADGVFVAFGSPEPELDFLPYAQNSNFRYLTGILEPNAALMITKTGGAVQQTLFVLPRNPDREVWEGTRLGPAGAQSLTGIPARPDDQLVPALDSALAHHATLYSITPRAADLAGQETLTREQQILQRVLARHPDRRVVQLNEPLRRLRGTKSASELDMLRRAVYISGLAHREAMRSVQPGMNEFEIQAVVEYTFRRYGSERPAYASIVGSGPNSTTLHYRDADRYMSAGEVLLMDVGASYRGYAADITRTVPVDGTFNAEQRAIYQVVLDAQSAAEQAVRPGSRWADAGRAADNVLANGLAALGLIDAADATYDCARGPAVATCPQYRIFYMHGLGHGVGLDVHDPDVFLNFGEFRVGSAFTIEPGIYVRADAFDFLPDTPRNQAMIRRLRPALERYRDIGIRIEDVYFLDRTGIERVSAGIPREIGDVEAMMREEGIGGRTRRADVVEWYRATEMVPRP